MEKEVVTKESIRQRVIDEYRYFVKQATPPGDVASMVAAALAFVSIMVQVEQGVE